MILVTMIPVPVADLA